MKNTCHNIKQLTYKKNYNIIQLNMNKQMPQYKTTHIWQRKHMPQYKTTHIWKKNMPQYKTANIKNTCHNIRQITLKKTNATLPDTSQKK
jgi:hypothetical protein